MSARAAAKVRSGAYVYSLKNTYLSNLQKALVEAVFQVPIGVFGVAWLTYMAVTPPPAYLRGYLFAAAVNLVFAIPLWAAARAWATRPVLFLPWRYVFAGRAASVIDLVFAAYLAYHQRWIAAAIGVGCALWLSTLFAPSLYLYMGLSRRMHPKYAIAKKLFGVRFRFEEEA